MFDFIFQCFFQGVLFAQLIYVALNLYHHHERKDYFFYLLYLVTSMLYFLYKTIMLYQFGWKYGAYPFPHNGLNYILANVMHLTYLKFAEHFINTKEKYPQIQRGVNLALRIILLFIFLNVFSLIFSRSLLPAAVQYAYSALLGIISLVLIGQMYRKRNRLINYIVTGGTAYTIGAVLSLVVAVLHVKGILPKFEHSLILTELGVLLEVLCFTAGLSYKSLLTEKDRHAAEETLFRQIQENQKLNARLETIKAKITNELQDEMGATLTGISIYSDIGEKYNQVQNKQGVSTIFEQIGQSARKMVNEVHDTIWMIQPQHNESAQMWQKAYQAATDAVLGKNIKLHFTIAEYAEKVPLDLELRKNIYLLIKECVANAVKHARCQNIWINYRVKQPTLSLTIRDDGKGFDPDIMSSGTGLVNLKKRVRHCRGDLGIQSDATGSEFYFEFKVEELPSSFS